MLFRSDRKSTRLNSSHTIISYAVFCLKKKNDQNKDPQAEPLNMLRPQPFGHDTTKTPPAEPLHILRPQHFGHDKNERQINFFNDTATTEIYTLSLHDALPI